MGKASGGTRSHMMAKSTIIKKADIYIENALKLINEKNDVNNDMRKRINKMLNRLSKLKGKEVNTSNWRKIYKEEAVDKVKELDRKSGKAKNENDAKMYLNANHAARNVFHYLNEEIRKINNAR